LSADLGRAAPAARTPSQLRGRDGKAVDVAGVASGREEGTGRMVRLYGNRYEGFEPAYELCDCSNPPRKRQSPRSRKVHLEHSDADGEAWRQLLALIDEAAADGRGQFAPSRSIPNPLWREIVTLPAGIGRLTRVRDLNLYGSNLIAIPPQIGGMTGLENFQPYTSRRLHWFPYELTRCTRLRDSTVSTRHLYGNFKTRLPFPALPAAVPEGSVPPTCSVCDRGFTESGPIQVWISLWVATDVLPLLVHACSQSCVTALPPPPEGYVQRPHPGGPTFNTPRRDAGGR
jgi:hypothetical protein